MRKDTVLVHVPCDVTRLPLDAFEGYLLSLVDGRLTLDELAEVAGTSLARISKHAEHLVEVGAVAVVGQARPARRDSGSGHAKARSRAPAIPRVTPVPGSRRSRRPSAPVSQHPVSSRSKPPRSVSSRPVSARPSSPRSVRPAAEETGAQLDEVARARILELDGRLGAIDHYALLGVARDADKAIIKRAYFALAAEFHPDRHFGKKLGPAKAPLERVFVRLTEAHDTLTIRARRADYDATLPSLPAPPPEPPPPSKRPAPRRSTKKMKAVESRRSPPPLATSVPAPASLSRPPVIVSSQPPAFISSKPLAGSSPRPPPSDDGLRRLYWSRKQNEAERRFGVFIEAAEAALVRDDVVTAVENYRLALQLNDDVEVRQKVRAIEWRAKGRIHETSLTRARASEEAGHWEEAATHYAKANAAKPEASTAERAAHAIGKHGGDVRRAVQLAEQAVLAEPQNLAYHLTLGEACLAAGLVARAAGEATRVLAQTPSDERAKALAAAAKKR